MAMRTKVLVAMAVLLAACGGVEKVEPSAPQPPATAGEVAVQVLVGGGFVPIEAAVTTVPATTILADGTVIMVGAVPAIYPGPAIQPLHVGNTGKDKVSGFVEKARALNLLGPQLDYGQPTIADASTTTVTITSGGTTYTQSVYALGMDGAPGTGRLTSQQLANRKAAQTFVEAVSTLPIDTRPWTPGAVAVYVLGPYQPDRDLTQSPVTWPLARLPERTGNRPCTVVDGTDAQTLLAAIGKANSRTPWVIERVQYSLAFRPIVPGQPGCPA